MPTNIEKIRCYISDVIISLDGADQEKSYLPKSILELDGMSSPKCRHLLNNLGMHTLFNHSEELNYLEIGLFKGSTFVSAAYDKLDMNFFGIENYSEFNDEQHYTNGKTVEQTFEENLLLLDKRPTVFKEDCFKIDLNKLPKIDIYFYDGNHSHAAQELAYTYFNPVLSDVFITIVDDWECKVGGPKNGTFAAFKKLGYKVRYYEELPVGEKDGYWGGQFIAVIEKP